MTGLPTAPGLAGKKLMGCGQVVKARGFDPRIPRFESWHPSHIHSDRAFNVSSVIR